MPDYTMYVPTLKVFEVNIFCISDLFPINLDPGIASNANAYLLYRQTIFMNNIDLSSFHHSVCRVFSYAFYSQQ